MRIKLKNISAFEELIYKSGFTKNSLSVEIGRERTLVHVITKRGYCNSKTAKSICDALGKTFDDIFLIEPLTKVSKIA